MDEEGTACLACITDPPPFEEILVWGEYEGVLRRAILALKHGGLDHLAPLLAGRLAARVGLEPWSEEIDVIVAVPSHPWHRLRRGFTASGLLAAAAGRRLQKPVRKVLRKRGVGRQAGLTRSRRLRLGGRRFSLSSRARINGRNILLIDDVTTTGMTLKRASQALAQGGAAAVYCAALAWVSDPRRM